MDKLFCCRITCYKKEKQRDFFRENARVFIIICMFALKKHMQYWARLIFFLFKKKYNCKVPFSYITQKLHLIFDAQDIYMCVSLQKTGYLFSNGQV